VLLTQRFMPALRDLAALRPNQKPLR